MLPRVKIAFEKVLPRAVSPLNRRSIGATYRRAGSGRLQHYSADSVELVPVVQESSQANASSNWTSSGDNHVSLLLGEPDTGRIFLRALISRLSPRDLNRVARVIGKSGSVKRTGRILEFSRRFHFAVGGDPVLLSLLEQFLKGSTVQVNSALARVDLSQPVDPSSLSSVEKRLLRLREDAPSFLGSYTKAPLHLVLSPRVFEVLTQVPGPDDKASAAASKTHDDSLAFIIKAADDANALTAPLSDEDFGAEKRSDLSFAARVIAARLIQTLPPATLEAFLNLLDEAEARLKTRGERYDAHSKYFNAMTQCLGHHWKGLGPDLCRFLRVYDEAAAAVCPFQASAEEHTAQLEEKLLLPLAAMRSKYVTTFVKDAGDPSADMRHLRSSMNNVFIESLFGPSTDANLSAIEESDGDAAAQGSLESLPPRSDDDQASSSEVELLALEDVAEKRQMVHQELLEADASVEVPQTSDKSPMYTSIVRTILVAMRATAEPYSMAAIAGEYEREAAVARSPVLEAWDELLHARSSRPSLAAASTMPSEEEPSSGEERSEVEAAVEDDRIGVEVSEFARDAGLWATECTVLIRGLPPDITNHELQRALARCGNVAGVWVYNRDEKVDALGDSLSGSALAEVSETESSPPGRNNEESDSGSEGVRSDCDDSDDDGSMGWVEDSAWSEVSRGVSTEAIQAHARRGGEAAAVVAAGSPDGAQPPRTVEGAAAREKSDGPAPLVSAEEAQGLSRKEYNALKAKRRAEAKQAKAEARGKLLRDREAAKLARAEARALAKLAREEAREAAKVAKAVAKSKPGRKKGVKSVIAAKTLLGRRKSDCYAFVEFTDPRGAQRATAQTLQTFGVCLESQSCRAGEMCRTMPALELRSVFIYTPKDESVTSVEVEHWVNEALSPHFSARILRGRTALLHEVTPSICRIDFPSHETAAWAYRQLENRPLCRGDHLPSVTFRMQWMKVSDSSQKAEKVHSESTNGVLFEK